LSAAQPPPATRDVRTADPSADGRRSAAIFASVELPSAGVISSRRPRGDTLLSICDARAHYLLTARILLTSISTDRIVSGTRSICICRAFMRPFVVCLSVCPIRPPHAVAAGLLLWARRSGDTDRLLDGRRAAGECGQCHAVSVLSS